MSEFDEVDSTPVSPDVDLLDTAMSTDEILVDDLLEGDRKLENFILELEEKMLASVGITKIKIWANKMYGISRHSVNKYMDIVRSTWKLEGTTMFVLEARRDEYRMMYKQIYRESLIKAQENSDPKFMAVALKTIDSLAELDGLLLPEMNFHFDRDGKEQATPAALTNVVRERTVQLMAAMRERAQKHAALVSNNIAAKLETRAVIPRDDDNDDKVEVEDIAEIKTLHAV